MEVFGDCCSTVGTLRPLWPIINPQLMQPLTCFQSEPRGKGSGCAPRADLIHGSRPVPALVSRLPHISSCPYLVFFSYPTMDTVMLSTSSGQEEPPPPSFYISHSLPCVVTRCAAIPPCELRIWSTSHTCTLNSRHGPSRVACPLGPGRC